MHGAEGAEFAEGQVLVHGLTSPRIDDEGQGQYCDRPF
jgi:hypothetical protein